jgi:hypothetical protein
MARTVRILTLAFVAVSLFLLSAGRVTAQAVIVSPPGVSYYYSTPAVTYYSPPPVVQAPAPSVSYSYAAPVSYSTPSVSYYAPAVTYYAPSVSYDPAPAAVTTTRDGLFGRPRVSTTYYPPVYIVR